MVTVVFITDKVDNVLIICLPHTITSACVGDGTEVLLMMTVMRVTVLISVSATGQSEGTDVSQMMIMMMMMLS